MHPLDRAADDDTTSRIDPNHVGRYFLDPSCRASETDQSMPEGAFSGDVVTALYQLPDGLTCTRCIVQMVYCECSCGVGFMAPLLAVLVIGRLHSGTASLYFVKAPSRIRYISAWCINSCEPARLLGMHDALVHSMACRHWQLVQAPWIRRLQPFFVGQRVCSQHGGLDHSGFGFVRRRGRLPRGVLELRRHQDHIR